MQEKIFQQTDVAYLLYNNIHEQRGDLLVAEPGDPAADGRYQEAFVGRDGPGQMFNITDQKYRRVVFDFNTTHRS